MGEERCWSLSLGFEGVGRTRAAETCTFSSHPVLPWLSEGSWVHEMASPSPASQKGIIGSWTAIGSLD